ncbi:MAG: CotH kinase family protein [Bacteroidetes bacterium]|nr:CotH kinase family protein [Bacteroidota bacterium]
MKRILLVLSFVVVSLTSKAQTFSGTGGAIPDNNNYVYFPITVSGLSSSVIDSSFGLQSVCINLLHNNDYHLTIQIVAPDGTTIDLSMNNGGTGNNYTNTCFSGTAITSITAGSPPFSGNFIAQGILGNVNNGQNGNGTWQLKIRDQNFGTSGTLLGWNMTFGNNPALPFVFSYSNLPIVVLNTNGQTIVDDPKIIAHMGIIYNGPGAINYLSDPFNNYDGNIGIEIRGSWSQTFPQKQYGFETLDSTNEEVDTMLLGMPAESDWILYAPYNDKTCMRNVLAYDIANKTGHYASRTQFCELVINNDYKGIYVLLEKIKRDSNRVDISKLVPADTTGDDLTGGYIIKIDKPIGGSTPGWYSNYAGYPGTLIRFQYEYPDYTEIMPQQKAYIESYVDSFENALQASWFTSPDSGYKKFIDVESFIDYFILNETSKNVDAYRNSTFLYKKKITKGGKLYIGPAWDYNIGFWNADYCEGYLTSGWQYQFNNVCGTAGDNNVPFWWARMLQDPYYKDALRCRWEELRLSVLHTDTLLNKIDEWALELDQAKDRHFTKWPVLGTVLWANPLPIANSYAGEVTNMKNWIQQRLTWLDSNIPGVCTLSGESELANGSNAFSIFPNPTNNKVTIRLTETAEKVSSLNIFNIYGQEVKSIKISPTHTTEIDISDLSQGIYFIKLNNNNQLISKIVKY